MDGDSPKTAVGNSNGRGFRRLGGIHFQTHVQGGVKRLVRVEHDRRTADGTPGLRTLRVCLERAIAYQFAVESAFVGKVDFLRHQSVQRGADGSSDPARVYFQDRDSSR